MPEYRPPREHVPAKAANKKAPRPFVIEYRTKPEKLAAAEASRFLYVPDWKELPMRSYTTETERNQALAKFDLNSKAEYGPGAFFEYRGATRPLGDVL